MAWVTAPVQSDKMKNENNDELDERAYTLSRICKYFTNKIGNVFAYIP